MAGAFGTSGGALVQSGQTSMAANTVDVALPYAVDPNKSYILVNTLGAADNLSSATALFINNGRTLRLRAATAGVGAFAYWQIVSLP